MLVRTATIEDISTIKQIADRNRYTLGFIPRPNLIEAQSKGWLWVACEDSQVLGFANCWRRRDGWLTIRELCVAEQRRNQGIGQLIIMALPRPIRLKCPVDNRSNDFYRKLGFCKVAVEPGKKRALNVWQLI